MNDRAQSERQESLSVKVEKTKQVEHEPVVLERQLSVSDYIDHIYPDFLDKNQDLINIDLNENEFNPYKYDNLALDIWIDNSKEESGWPSSSYT